MIKLNIIVRLSVQLHVAHSLILIVLVIH